MAVLLPLVVGDATTTGAATATVVTMPLSVTFFGKLKFELTGELSGDPTTTYSYYCEALYENSTGVAALVDQGTPIELDPDAKAFTVTLDATGSSARMQVLGLVGENWIWAGRIYN